MNAIGLASVLALVSIGLAIIFGMMNVINLAHGEFVTVGAYTTAVASSLSGNFWIGLMLAPLIGGIAGLALETMLIRHLYKRPLHTIIATLGVSFIVQKLIELTLGPSPLSVSSPLPGLLRIGGTSYPIYRVFIIGFAVATLSMVFFFYRRTRFGLDLRSAIQSPTIASILGINVDRTYRIAFVAGSSLAALAGGLIAPIASIVPGMGLSYLIESFFVVIVGGTGTIIGSIAGSAVIGGAEAFFSFRVGGAFPQALVLILAILIVRLRPRGLIPA
jgi:branched-chain amino acid transport system permease protein/urea transport system permease protein